jgi:hypothetical protein
MEADGVTRIFVGENIGPDTWTQEVFPESDTTRLEGNAHRDVRLRLNAVCSDAGEKWEVSQVLAGAWAMAPFEIAKDSDEETGLYPALVESLEQRLGASGLTVLVTKPETMAS